MVKINGLAPKWTIIKKLHLTYKHSEEFSDEYKIRSNQPFNTQYAPLGLLLALYKQKQVLKPLENVKIRAKIVHYSPTDKLEQILVSILSGRETLSEVNTKLRGDIPLAKAGGWKRIADQSTLSLTLDGLSHL